MTTHKQKVPVRIITFYNDRQFFSYATTRNLINKKNDPLDILEKTGHPIMANAEEVKVERKQRNGVVGVSSPTMKVLLIIG